MRCPARRRRALASVKASPRPCRTVPEVRDARRRHHGRQRPRRRGAARRRRRQFRLPRRRLRPARRRLPHPELSLSAAARSRRCRSTAGSRIRRCAPTAQSVGGSYIFEQRLCRRRGDSQFASLYRMPGHRGDRDQHPHRHAPDQGRPARASTARRPPPSTRSGSGSAHTDYKHNELANESGFDGIQQTFTNKEQEGRVEVQLAPFDLRFAALTTALGVQGGHQRADRAGRRGRPVRSQPDHQRRRLHVQRVPLQRRRCGCRSPAASSRSTVKGSVPDLFVDPDHQHRARPPLHAEERRHRLPPGSAVGPGRAA